MAVKSVIDVEVNDEDFKEFAKLFEKYQEALGATPGVWAKAESASRGTALNVESLVAALLTHEAINKKIAREEEEKRKKLAQQNQELTRQRQAYKDIARSVLTTFTTIAKWSAYSGIASGLIGFGGLAGIDRLADITGAGRQRAQGLGARYGEAKAFDNSFGRLVDTQSLLGGTNEALTDVTKRAALFGAGLSQRDIASGDSADVGLKILDSVKRLVDRTPTELLANVAAARGLGQFGFTNESLRALKATSAEEYASIRKGYGAKVGQFDVEDKIARKWQDLGVQLDSAKIKIEGVLVTGLEKLADPLGRLSDHVAKALETFIKGIDQKTIDDIGQGIDSLGKYLGSPQFRTDVKNFAEDISYASQKIVGALRWLGLIPDRSDQNPDDKSGGKKGGAANGVDSGDAPTAKDRLRGGSVGAVAGGIAGGILGSVAGPAGIAVGEKAGTLLGGAAGAILPNGVKLLGERAYAVGSPNWTNPGNIRWPGSNKFVRFDNANAGVRAIARQVELYEKRDKLNTIQKIIEKYAPAKDHNNVEAYVRDVESYTGIGRNQKLDASSTNQIAKIVAGITKHEGNRRYTADQVKVIIENNTGGSAITQSSQVAKQG